jgi:hypothetical protein
LRFEGPLRIFVFMYSLQYVESIHAPDLRIRFFFLVFRKKILAYFYLETLYEQKQFIWGASLPVPFCTKKNRLQPKKILSAVDNWYLDEFFKEFICGR